MLWTIAAIFALLWVLGLVTTLTLGGFIHVFLIVAITLIVVGALKTRKRPGQRESGARSHSSTPDGRRP